MTKSNSEPDQCGLDFESTIAKLRALVDTLEKEDSSLESAMLAFQDGVRIIREAQSALDLAEQKVSHLLKEHALSTDNSSEAGEEK